VGDRVVPRSRWADETVGDGDRVEIITASQGG
jgi:sulfur carrier protein